MPGFTVRAITTAMAITCFVSVNSAGEAQQGFGRFGRENEDGLLTFNVSPYKADTPPPVSGLSLRFASPSTTASVISIDTSQKTLALTNTGPNAPESIRYTLLYPGFSAVYTGDATIHVSTDRFTVETVTTDSGGSSFHGLLLMPASGSQVPILLAFQPDLEPSTWNFVDEGSTGRLEISAPGGLGEVRFITPYGVARLSASASAAAKDELRTTAREWLPRLMPRLVDRSVDYDSIAGEVVYTETFSNVGGSPFSPIPPVLGFAISRGYPASVDGTISRSAFNTKYGPFAWVDGTSTVTTTLPVPPLDDRGYLKAPDPSGRVALLNDLVGHLGGAWATNAVDLGYAGMSNAQMAFPYLDASRTQQLAVAWDTWLPLAFRLPPYPPGDTKNTWKQVTEPFTGLDYYWTYKIDGPAPQSYPLDLEWGIMLPIYGLYKYAQFSGDWEFVQQHWPAAKQVMVYLDHGDDWAWMTVVNGDIGYSTGTGDPMTAAFCGHVAALKIARALGDAEAEKHYAFRAARVAVPSVARFWYYDWAVSQGFIPQNQMVLGFWERSHFTTGTMSETSSDPWSPTNILSGDGILPEFFDASEALAPGALEAFENVYASYYPNWSDGSFNYPFATIYGGNSVYITFPHIYARSVIGEETSTLWGYVDTTESNRFSTAWVGPNVIAELLSRDAPLYFAEWQPAAYLGGDTTPDGNLVEASFRVTTPQSWHLAARLRPGVTPVRVLIDGVEVPCAITGDRLSLTANVSGTFTVSILLNAVRLPFVIDNEDESRFTTSGLWPFSANTPFVGSTSQYATGGGGADEARWIPTFIEGGTWDVYTTWVAAGNRASNAPYRVVHAEGFQEIRVDQKANGNQWNLLGRFRFDAGQGGYVSLSDDGVVTGELVSADAVRFVPVATDAVTTAWVIRGD